MLEAVCPSVYDLEFSGIESQLSSKHERGRSDCLGEKLEVNLANMISTDTVNTRNSGLRYSGFTCFSGQNCADHL